MKGGRGGLTVDLGLPIFANVLAAAGIWVATRNVTAALGAVVAVQSIAIIYLIVRPQVSGRALGLRQSWRHAKDGPEPREILAKAEIRFSFWGISAKSMLSDEDFRSELVRLARRGCNFKFLFLNPDSSHLSTKAEEEGDTAEGWRQEIRANVARLQRLHDELGIGVQVRFYDEYPVFRVFFVDRDAYVGWYPRGEQGVKSPFARVADSHASLYYPLHLAFENHWRLDEDRIRGTVT